MQFIATILKELGLPAGDPKPFRDKEMLSGPENSCIYTSSLYKKDEVLYFIGRDNEGQKHLYAVAEQDFDSSLQGVKRHVEGLTILCAELSVENSRVLRKLFPFTSPVSLRSCKTTFGCGDRLGMATGGHIRAARRFEVSPVLAQQSIRELNLTGRNYAGVLADAVFLVFQEGYEDGYGADGDHLKTLEDIDVALDAGMPMITLDLSDVMNADAADWNAAKVDEAFAEFGEDLQKRLLESFADRDFPVGDTVIKMSELETKRCSVMYQKALDHAKDVDRKLRDRRGDQYDLEISIDETTAPTLPSHHLYIIRELNHRAITVNSLAPRFIGEFQKGIDYIGDLKEFENQFKVHCDIAKSHGDYKVSIHSGSDKLSAYPIIGRHTNNKLHVKTAGTSWLEAVRAVAIADPALYRRMHAKAFEHFKEASKLYHITADLSKIPSLDSVEDDDLPKYMDWNESRQLLHITYGGLLNDPEVRDDFFSCLDENEELYMELLDKHIGLHMEKLGLPTR